VTTSEFDQIKQRMIRLESGEKIQEARDGGGKPSLQTKAEQKQAKSQQQGQQGQGDDNAPVLKRRP
jgi:hypothetical protein